MIEREILELLALALVSVAGWLMIVAVFQMKLRELIFSAPAPVMVTHSSDVAPHVMAMLYSCVRTMTIAAVPAVVWAARLTVRGSLFEAVHSEARLALVWATRLQTRPAWA